MAAQAVLKLKDSQVLDRSAEDNQFMRLKEDVMAKDAIGNPSSVTGNGAAATVFLVVAVLGDVNTEDVNELESSDEHPWTVGRQWIPGTRTQGQRANESRRKRFASILWTFLSLPHTGHVGSRLTISNLPVCTRDKSQRPPFVPTRSCPENLNPD